MLNPSPSSGPLKIVIYRTSSLGDVVLGFACLDLLQQLKVPCEITWVGRGPTLEILRTGWPKIRIVEIVKSDTLKDIQKTAETLGDTHVFVDLQCNLRSRYFGVQLKRLYKTSIFTADKAQFARSTLIANARIRGRRKPLPPKALEIKKPQFVMMLETLKKALRHQLPIEVLDELVTYNAVPKIPTGDAVETIPHSWHKELKFGNWLAIAPGASTPTKRAPELLFIESIKKAASLIKEDNGLQNGNFGIVLLGDENDRLIANQILDELDWQDSVLNLCGKLSLWESAVALSESNCLITNDSSLGHIAEAVDTPIATLFGPTIESFGFAPRKLDSKAFSSNLGCRPCSKHGKIACRYGDHLCFYSISTDNIASHLYSMLKKTWRINT